jgi:hypothetical protein
MLPLEPKRPGHTVTDIFLFRSLENTIATVGKVVDPFLSLLNHSCDPNVSIFSEVGGAIYVRAIKHIPAGTELTHYSFRAPDLLQDYLVRKFMHNEIWGRDCVCDPCCQQIPAYLPEGELESRFRELAAINFRTDNSRMRSVERLIKDMLKAGYGYSSFPMYELHWFLRRGYEKNLNLAGILKVALKMHYFIQPVQNPPAEKKERLLTLYTILTTMDTMFRTGNASFPTDIMKLLPGAILHLRKNLVKEYTICFDAESKVVKYEKATLEKLRKVYLKAKYPGLEPKEDGEESKNLKDCMDAVMKWAGLGSKTEDQLLAL